MTQRHYEFTGEVKELHHVTLRRIRATRDLPRFNVAAGDEGGWIEHTGNLADDAWVSDEAWVYGNAKVFEDAWVAGNACVSGNARIFGTAWIVGNARISMNAQVFGRAWVGGDVHVYCNAQIFGCAEINDHTGVFDDAQIFGNACVVGYARVHGSAKVSGDTRLSGDAEIFGHAEVTSNNDYLHLLSYTSQSFDVTLFKETGGGHAVIMGCWKGTIDDLEELFMKNQWMETNEEEADQAREEMLDMCRMLRSRIKRWNQN